MMSAFLCEVCGHVFHEPLLRSYTDLGPDNIRIPYTVVICPACGAEDVETLIENQEESL